MLEMAILGVLKEQPMHGYELRHYLSFIVGHIWQLSYGTLYPALRRLEKRGELTRKTVREGRGPAKHVYAMTETGEQKFVERLAHVSSLTEISDSHKFNLRLVFFRYLPTEARQELLRQRLEFLHQNRESLTEMEQFPSSSLDSFRRSLISYHASMNGAEIAFVEKLLQEELASDEGTTPDPRRALTGASTSPSSTERQRE